MSSSDSESSDSESGSSRRFKIGAKLPTFKDGDDIITYKMQMEAHIWKTKAWRNSLNRTLA
jgi:hypothetical protein